MHNEEWILKENAYCLIRLLEWRNHANLRDRDALITEMKFGSPIACRSEEDIRLHFEYLDGIIGGKPTQIEQDQYLVGLYPKTGV